MLSLYSRLATQAVNTALKSSVRTVYSANFLRVDTFKNYSERIRQENANNSNVIKQGIRDAVSKPDGKIFTEDLKSYLYHAETDDEINTLIDAIKKYHQQASLSLFSFNFDVPLMRLLYVQNKTDKAIDLYMKEEFFNKSANVTLLLLNKLVEEKRFDDVLKVAEKHVQDVANARAAAGTTTTTTTTTGNQGRIVSLDGLKLVSEALLLKNDASAFEQGVKFFKKAEELKIVAPARCIHQMVFLALEQNKPDVAFDMLNKIDKLNTIKANLKIMALIGMNRLEEATKQAEELLKHTQEEKKKGAISKSLLLFYPSTLDSLVKKTESNEQLKPRSQTVIDTAKQQNLVLANDIRSSLVRVIEQRRVLGDNNNRNFNRPNNRNNQQQQQQQQGEQQPRRFVNNNNANNQNRQFRTFNNNNNQGQRRPQQQQQGGQDQQQQQQQPQRFQNQRRA